MARSRCKFRIHLLGQTTQHKKAWNLLEENKRYRHEKISWAAFYNSILHNGGSEGKGKQKLRKVVKTCSAYIAESASYYSA